MAKSAKLEKRYEKHYKNKKVKNSLDTIDCLDISFQYKEKDRLISSSDEAFNDFEVIMKPGKADLILGIS
ncbi:159_t:CDS:2 [Funneliformis mosseae]|uniref:159_t:CDS:1 n=1 Tax=Funneliformis mosseae TaxID=27381 RepID=A0A9N8YTU9_FUNMO|nr:159_t:CDS:2 [Funneliformis mosseae]